MSSQTPGPSAKRRRVDVANAALRKPFRSPLINRPTPTAEGAVESTPGANNSRVAAPNIDTPTPTRFGGGRLVSTPVRAPSHLTSDPSGVVPHRPSYSAGASKRGASNSSNSRRRDTNKRSSPLIEQLRRTQRDTTIQLRKTQDHLGIVRQAGRMEAQSRAKRSALGLEPGPKLEATEIDVELRELIDKWKFASRQAAEDVFELIRGRVEDMGGAKAWRETRRQQRDFFRGVDEEERGDRKKKTAGDHEEEDGCGSGDQRDDHIEERGDEESEEGVDKESGFTMLMMMQSLNIDPVILGYDPVEDKWQD
ncbi:hypothetical protein B0H67DRAFT_638879 [Lasiosphaeris hirsuta]|uniref:Swi5-dependent recombination DNA repair protein 1 n=1 Tax=Lasiosphaeris hirsuta TaxID=260670 RepID=A0AA40B9X4_9PEZI|nr:hypothetical protein B0H67DRAFT_638879 [Lasiosphaeris hirsuta]